MKTIALCLVASLALVKAEAPLGGGGYSYSAPSGGGGSFGGHSSGGGALIPVSPGYQTHEGQHVDGQILEQVRQIILKDEASSVHRGVIGGGSYPSSQYGVPSTQYGVPQHHYISRVVGVDLEGIKQAIQVAQYIQHGYEEGGYNYAPARPSGSYGVPH